LRTFGNITTGSRNVAIGSRVLQNGQTISNCVGVGHYALQTNLASDVVAIGSEALDINTLGTANVAVGRSALGAATTAAATVTITTAGSGGPAGPTTYSGVQLTYVSGATAVTYPTADITVTSGAVSAVTIVSGGTGFTATSGTVMTAAAASIGNTTGFTCTLATGSTASSNTAVGHQAGLSLTTGSNNTLLGALTGDAITTGSRNSAFGQNALGATTSGGDNMAFGANALQSNTTGSENVAIGIASLRDTQSNARNTAIGGSSLVTLTSGQFNVAIGHNAGRLTSAAAIVTTCNNSTFIGYEAFPNADSQTNQTAIGYQAVGDGSNTTVIGNTSTTQARIRGATFLSTGANGQSTQLGQSTTLLSGLTGATVTATNLIPANSILLGVTARVTTAITGATTFDIGDGTTANRFGDDVAIALNTTSNRVIDPALVTAATSVVLTANGSNFTGGAVRLTAHFMTLVAPTS
jgi:hypothetical protein